MHIELLADDMPDRETERRLGEIDGALLRHDKNLEKIDKRLEYIGDQVSKIDGLVNAKPKEYPSWLKWIGSGFLLSVIVAYVAHVEKLADRVYDLNSRMTKVETDLTQIGKRIESIRAMSQNKQC